MVPFSIFEDVFLPANDPYGRNGTTLDQMLLPPQNSDSNTKQPIIMNQSTLRSADFNNQTKGQNNKNQLLNEKPKVDKKSDNISSNQKEGKTSVNKINIPVKKTPIDQTTQKKSPPKKENKDPYSIFDEKSDDDELSDDDENDQQFYFDTDEDNDEAKSNEISSKSNDHDSDAEFPYKSSVIVRNAKKFKRYFTVKKAELTDNSTFIAVSSVNGGRASMNLLFKVKSNNKNKFDKAVNTVKSWKIMLKKISFNQEEFSQLVPQKKTIIDSLRQNLKDKKEVFINFDPSQNQINVMWVDNSRTRKVISIFENNCFSKIDFKEEIITKNDLEYELLHFALNNIEFIKKNKLQSIKLEFKKPFKERNLNGKVIFKGKKNQMKNVNFSKFQKLVYVNDTYMFKKKDASFIRNRLDKYTHDLKLAFVTFTFEIAKQTKYADENKLNFQILGFDQNQVQNIKKSLVENFLKKATSTVIQFKSNDDLVKIEGIVKEFRKSLNAASDKASEVGSEFGDENAPSFNFEMDVEIVFNQQLKMIFLNGTDAQELEEVKTNLLDKINGSKDFMQSVRYPILVFNNLLREKFVDKIKPKYIDTKITLNCNQNLIRMNGPKDQVEMALNDLNQMSFKISNQIVTSSIEINKSEFSYLESRINDVNQIENETSSLVCMSPFERYATVEMKNNINIELILGDLTKLHVDAYINPANINLKHTLGLAKMISQAGGKLIEQECNKFIVDFGTMMDGDVFISSSGNLGCKSNSIVAHAVGPIWNGGFSQEEAKLRNAVRNSLDKIDAYYQVGSANSISVAIPPISTGIFNYPIKEATRIISETLIDYLMRKPNSKIKDIKLISNELETINSWEESLMSLSLDLGLKFNALRNLACNEALRKKYFQIFFSAHINNSDVIYSKIRKIVDSGYVTEKVLDFGHTSERIQQLELEFEAVICKENDYLIISAIEENLFLLKNTLVDFDLISFD